MEIRPKNFRKCLLASTGTKIYFSNFLVLPKSFEALHQSGNSCWFTNTKPNGQFIFRCHRLVGRLKCSPCSKQLCIQIWVSSLNILEVFKAFHLMSLLRICRHLRNPLSRYTCRSRFPRLSCIAVVPCYTPPPHLKGPVAPVARQLPGASHIKLSLSKVSRYRGVQ